MLKNLKITTKLLVIGALLATTAVLTISYVGIYTAKKSTINTQITMLEHIANLKVDKIESFFNERRVDIKIAQDYFNIKTNLPIATQFAADRTNPAYITAKKMLDSQIKAITDANECYVDFMLVNPEGKVMYSANELHEKIDLDNPLTGSEGEKAFEQGKKGVYFSDIYASEFEDYVYGMLITAPVNDFDGQFIGIVALELNMNPIYEFIQETTGLGKTGETLIGKKVDDGAQFLNSLRHEKDTALKRKAIFGEKNAFPILEAVQGRNGAGLSIDYRGKEIISAWRNIPALDWGLVAKIDMAEALSHVNGLKKIVLYIACFIIAIALIGALWLSISITVPVKKLSDTVLKISQGDLKQRVDIESKDEIGQLADSFNMMTDKLMVSKDELIMAANHTDNIIKTMADTLIVVTPDAAIKMVNQATLTLLGYKEDELIGKPINMIIAEGEEEELFKRSGIDDLIKKGFISGVEKSYLSKDGCKIPVLFSGSVMRDVGGNVQGIVCVASDITERKQMGENLALRLNQQAIIANVGVRALAGTDMQMLMDEVVAHVTQTLNVEYCKLLELLPDDNTLLLRAGVGWKNGLVGSATVGVKRDSQAGYTLSSSKPVIVEDLRTETRFSGPPLLHGHGVISGMSVIIQGKNRPFGVLGAHTTRQRTFTKNDIHFLQAIANVVAEANERKQLEEERQDMQLKMMQSSKLASLGEIATGVAHEINQPLTYISTFLQNIRDDIEDKIKTDERKLEERSKVAYSQVKRINNIVRHLRTFGRQINIEMCPISIETVFNNTLLLMGEQIRLRNINLIKSIEPDLPMVLGNSNRLEEVFINLLQNATDTFDKRSKSAEIHFEVSLCDDKGSLIIKVKDNGMGIEKEALDKIFEPFFTTKEVGNGTGLGLSIVYGIIKEHGGTISCESVVGKGAAFTIMLPVA